MDERVRQVAIGHEVTVPIGPAAGHDVGHAVDWIRRIAVGALETLSDHVLVQRYLECRLAVAEQVVRRSEARDDVVPAGHLGFGERHAACRYEQAGNQRLLGKVAAEVIEPHAVAECQPVERPFVLRVDPEIPPLTLCAI